MGRKRRSIDMVPGGIYHVMSRGNRKAVIFEDNSVRRRFREILATELEVHGVELLVENEMDTHYHLTVETPLANLSDFMCQLNGQFARYSNWRYKRVGHLFQGPFRHVLVESDLQLFSTASYVFRNPTNARMVRKIEHYKWSSYAATAGLAPCPGHLSVEWLKVLLPGASLEKSQRRLREIMDDENPLAAYLYSIEREFGAERPARHVRSYVEEQRRKARERLAARTPLEQLMPLASKDRSRFIYEARVIHGYAIREIGRAIRLQPANVSKIFREFLRRRRISTKP